MASVTYCNHVVVIVCNTLKLAISLPDINLRKSKTQTNNFLTLVTLSIKTSSMKYTRRDWLWQVMVTHATDYYTVLQTMQPN